MRLLQNEDDQSALNKALLEIGSLDFGSHALTV
ncbi:MAG: hypothetical protein EBV02_02800, partial [Actinobacteria bacterium]|nr:hypothetical protein [Actinomycetota bacterium]